MKKLMGLMFTLVLLLSGCSTTSDVSNENVETFVVGMECNYAPFNWQTNSESETSISIGGAGYCDGYDVMIAQEIANDLDKQLVIKKLSWDGLQPSLESGEIDAIIAGMTANDERENGIDFTTPYYQSEMVMLVRKNDEAASFTDIQQFSGKNVIGQKNTNYDEIIDQIVGVNHATPKAAYPEMILSLQNGEVDGITAELPVAEGVVQANEDLTIAHFDEGKGFDINTSVSIGLKEGSRGGELFESIQNSLNKISDSTKNDFMNTARLIQPNEERQTFFGKVAWIFSDNFDLFIYGIKITLLLALVGTIGGLLIGLFLGTLRTVEIEDGDSFFIKLGKRIIHGFVSLYVWFIRGTPMMVQAVFFFGLLRPIIHWDALSAGLVIISVNTGAYMAEIIRSGIQAVDAGQNEGARSIGMSNHQTMISIILPQAIKNSFPSIGNQFIVNIKDSSMLNVIGVIDLYFQSSSAAGSVMLYNETFFITCIIYLLLTSIATLILNATEKHLNKVPEIKESEVA